MGHNIAKNFWEFFISDVLKKSVKNARVNLLFATQARLRFSAGSCM